MIRLLLLLVEVTDKGLWFLAVGPVLYMAAPLLVALYFGVAALRGTICEPGLINRARPLIAVVIGCVLPYCVPGQIFGLLEALIALVLLVIVPFLSLAAAGLLQGIRARCPDRLSVGVRLALASMLIVPVLLAVWLHVLYLDHGDYLFS